jgi:hypothetical protein
MKIRNLIQAAAVTGTAITFLAASASASTITYSTNAAGTEFTNDSSLTLNDSLGAAATITFTPNGGSTSGVPSNIDLGDFLVTCTTCSTQAQGAGSFFNAFTFDLVITDSTDGATGEFVGTSTGGQIYSNASTIVIDWSPLQLGPGTTGALTGSFAATDFTVSHATLEIVAPNSGTPPGDTTVQGFVSSSAVPEPATFGLMGGALLAFGIFRKRVSRS